MNMQISLCVKKIFEVYPTQTILRYAIKKRLVEYSLKCTEAVLCVNKECVLIWSISALVINLSSISSID